MAFVAEMADPVFQSYFRLVGGGNGSRHVWEALQKEGLEAGIKTLGNEGILSAIRTMNSLGLEPAFFPHLAILFTLANPAIAVALTIPIPGWQSIFSKVLNATPVLASAWPNDPESKVPKVPNAGTLDRQMVDHALKITGFNKK